MQIPELMAGWQRFRAGRFREQRALFERIAREGQRPRVMMIACSDSRVDPAIIFDCDPGDLFLVRNVANLVPPYEQSGNYHGTSAAIEFAVRVLGVQDIVVLGHTQCGGIRALLEGAPVSGEPMPFLTRWMTLADEARVAALTAHGLPPEQRAALCGRLAVRVSIRNLLTFPALRDRVSNGALHVHGWLFDLKDGVLTLLDDAANRFVPFDGGAASEAAT